METRKKEQFSLKARINSFGYAFKGIAYMMKTQHNAWIHLIAAVIVIIVCILLNISISEWCFIIFAIGLVFAAEAFNTAIERLVDLASPGYNEIAGKVKDVAAGAVLIAAITAAIVGLIILLPKIIDLL